MKVHWFKTFGLMIGLILIAGFVMAQTTGAIVGTVVDNNGQPLPGVSLEITSPAMQGTRVTQTDVNGNFRFNLVPIGSYIVTTKMEGFATLKQEGVKVGLDKTVTLKVKMQPAFEETVTVTGEAPVIDVTSTTTGADISQEVMEDLPAGRSYQQLSFLAPGAVDGGLGNNASIQGSSSAENRYVVDGIDTTDPAFGTSGTNVTFNFVQEVEVKAGGYEAEYGGALGGYVNVVTKTGSNEFHGEVFGYSTDDSFTAKGKTIESRSYTLDSFETYDFGADVGGKIIEDKLWYFVAYDYTDHTETRLNSIYVPDYDVTITNDMEPENQGDYYAAKLTYNLNANNSFTLTVIGDPTDHPGDYYTSFFIPETYSGVPTDQTYGDSTTGGNNYGLTWNSVLTPSLLFEFKANHHDNKDEYTPNLDYPHYEDGSGSGMWSGGVGNRVRFGGPGFQQMTDDRTRDQFKMALSWYLGNHELRFGVQYNSVSYETKSGVAGSSDGFCAPMDWGEDGNPWAGPDFQYAYHYDATTGEYVQYEPNCDSNNDGVLDGLWMDARNGNRFRMRGWGYYNSNYKQDSTGDTDEWTLFMQDAWKVTPYLTLKAGLRADDYKITGEASNINDLQKIELNFQDQIAPRLGFTWDFAHNGRSKLFGHYGMFYESIPLDINVRAFGNENYDLYYYYYPDNGELPSTTNPGTLLYILNLGLGTSANPDLQGQYLEETVLGAEYEIQPNLAIGVKGIYRSLGRVIEDISFDQGNTYYITNPGGCTNVNPVNGVEFDDMVCFPTPSRIYRAVEFTLNKRFSNHWQMYNSLLWSQNKGNYGGLFRQDNGQLDPNITSLYDLPSLLKGAYGLMPNDRTWQFKSYGSYRFNYGLTVGYDFRFLSGTPINKMGSHSIYGSNERFVVPRGTAGRLPSWYTLNMHFSYPFKIGDGMELSVIADIFNILGKQTVTAVDQEWTVYDENSTDEDGNYIGDEQTNEFWGTPTAYQSSRSFRAGVKFSW